MMAYRIINFDDRLYPEKLKNIKNPPKKLYAKGNFDLLNKDMIAVVGSRSISSYGKKYAEIFSKEIALRKIPIVSGLAKGVDAIAHRQALENNCPTIAVLGVGLNNIYPEENIGLYNDIINSGGLVLTEEEPDVKYDPLIIIKRNRIVSGLSECVLVIEAGYRSGTSITVERAREQNKNVFVVPARLDDKKAIWSNKFIKEGGKLITDIEDILECYPQFMHKKRIIEDKICVKAEYADIYNLLKEKNCSIDEMVRSIQRLSVAKITNLLTMMELEDLIEKDFGNGYRIKENNGE